MDRDEQKDAQSLKILEQMLSKYDLSAEEQDAVRTAIGLLAWTKLIEGYKERKKNARDRRELDV